MCAIHLQQKEMSWIWYFFITQQFKNFCSSPPPRDQQPRIRYRIRYHSFCFIARQKNKMVKRSNTKGAAIARTKWSHIQQFYLYKVAVSNAINLTSKDVPESNQRGRFYFDKYKRKSLSKLKRLLQWNYSHLFNEK